MNVHDVESAIRREKQLKGWLRNKKNALVDTTNPLWHDLSEGWYSCHPERSEGSHVEKILH